MLTFIGSMKSSYRISPGGMGASRFLVMMFSQ
jgi:hypothetical protein